MGQQIYAVRVGTKYGPEFEKYHESKLGKINWIREETIGPLQWNKLVPMGIDTDEAVCVIDIDQAWLNDYHDIINYPIKRGEFLFSPSWWSQSIDGKYKMHGGFQKYYPRDCKFILEKYLKDPNKWQQHYIDNGTTVGPVNGEQFFVHDSAAERLDIKYFPAEWNTKWINMPDKKWVVQANMHYPLDYLYLDEFNPQIRLVHFQTQDPNAEYLKVLK